MRNFDRHIRALMSFSKAARIKVLKKEGDFWGGEYNDHLRLISIDPSEPEEVQLACFLHELGHAFDHVLTDPPLRKTLAKAYSKYYQNQHKRYQHSLVLQCEQRAWDFGIGLAKLLRIPLGRWFYKIKRDALGVYRRNRT